ncbi:hypothetical protein CJF31_00010641 [Rutstroemia sp. NJR-2017a BVV2]|nr:hypothetical protein CJF31_00010641 [Rutstroemia sp. NJR-2017a BVV2]
MFELYPTFPTMAQPPGAIAMSILGNSSGVQAPPQHVANPPGSQNAMPSSPGVPCPIHKTSPNPNAAIRCVDFFACWDCGPIGTIIATITFVVGTIISYYTIKLAIWTATKDYIEYCQSGQEAQRATMQCQEVAGQPLPPPPFFRHDPTNSTNHRRTAVGVMIGATLTRRYDSLYVWVDALLLSVISWMVLSAVCYLAYSIVLATRKELGSPLSMEIRDMRENLSSHIRVDSRSRNGAYSSASSIIQSVGTESNQSSTTVRRRGNGKSDAASLFKESLNCPLISDDYGIMERRWKRQGASFRPYLRPNNELQWKDAYSEFSSEHLQAHSLRNTWFKDWGRGADINVKLLHNLYGLEISACTGNARRISLIELIFTTSVKRYLKLVLQGSSSFTEKVLGAIEKKDPIDFLECYTEYPEWRDDFVRLLNLCFVVLAGTGVDSRGNLNALYTSESGRAAMVTLPEKSHSWAEILEDSTESFTLAVFADTCLSARGRACIKQRESWKSNAILETRLWFPECSVGPTSLTANTLGDRYFIKPAPIADKRLSYAINTTSGGYLKITEALRHSPQSKSNSPQAFLACWTQTKNGTRLLPNMKQSHFSECLVEDGRRYFLTYITSDVEKKREKSE